MIHFKPAWRFVVSIAFIMTLWMPTSGHNTPDRWLMSEPPEDPLPVAPFGDEAVQQVFDLWLTPEVERRRAAGRLPQPIRKAQIIFEVDGRPVVRFNDEVRVIMTVRTTRAVTKGEVVSSADFSEHQFDRID